MRGQLKSVQEEVLPHLDAASGPRRPVIAIDGPAGAGKSTLAAHLARRFGFLNIETGAMYRALALKAIESDLSFDEEGPLLALAQATSIVLEPHLDGNRVRLDGMDVSQRIRETDVTSAASQVSIHPRVRAWMVQQQRALGVHGGVVMEGRDIGTAVFPDAEVKIFSMPRRRSAAIAASAKWLPWRGPPRARPSPVRPPPPPPPSSSAWPSRPLWTRCASATAAIAIAPNRPCARPPTPSSSTPPPWAWMRSWPGPKRSSAPTSRQPDLPPIPPRFFPRRTIRNHLLRQGSCPAYSAI